MIKYIKIVARQLLGERLWLLISRIRRGYRITLPFRPTFNEDSLVSGLNVDFLTEPKFKTAYEKAVAEKLYVCPDIRWRLYVACWAGAHALALEGDFVECGVNKGFMSRIVMDYLDFGQLHRTFYLLDTFRGFDENYLTAEEQKGLKEYAARNQNKVHWTQGAYTPCYDIVVRAFSQFNNVIIIKGTVPDTLIEVTSEKVVYLSIDMNCVSPEIAAIEYFWPKLVSGAVVILDDYGFPAHEAQKRAMDLFASKVGVKILTLPTGQGLIIKT